MEHSTYLALFRKLDSAKSKARGSKIFGLENAWEPLMNVFTAAYCATGRFALMLIFFLQFYFPVFLQGYFLTYLVSRHAPTC